MIKRPIIALDFKDALETRQFLGKFGADAQLFVKIGMELFYAAGPDIVREVRALGHDVFLDLKLHDIPHTVEMGMRSIAQLGVTMTTTHISGGSAMLEAAKLGLASGSNQNVKLLGITQLTSTSETQMHQEQHIAGSLTADVVHRTQLAMRSGCDGVVCSALEAQAISAVTTPDFLRITPGIRPNQNDVQDQVRVVTPAKAQALGSTGIVVGRPITQAPDPVQAYADIMAAWQQKGIQND